MDKEEKPLIDEFREANERMNVAAKELIETMEELIAGIKRYNSMLDSL